VYNFDGSRGCFKVKSTKGPMSWFVHLAELSPPTTHSTQFVFWPREKFIFASEYTKYKSWNMKRNKKKETSLPLILLHYAFSYGLTLQPAY